MGPVCPGLIREEVPVLNLHRVLQNHSPGKLPGWADRMGLTSLNYSEIVLT